MPPKKKIDAVDPAPNGVSKHNGHVSLSREEYDALMAREESFVEAVASNAKNVNRLNDVVAVCDAQARRLSESMMTIAHLERANGLQQVLVDALRDDAGVASLADLTKFWQQWSAAAENAAKVDSQQRDEVSRFEPDIFRSWRLWVRVRDAGRISRSVSVAGSREAVEAAAPKTQAELQEQITAQLRVKNAHLVAQVSRLEAEVDAYKKRDRDR